MRIKIPVAVVAQPDLLIPVLALQAKRLGHFVHAEPLKAAHGIVSGRPDDSPFGAGQLLGQSVDVIVIVIELFVRVNDRQRLEGARVIDVFAIMIAGPLGDQGIAVPGEQGLPVADGFVAAAAQGIVAHGDGLCIRAFDGAQAVLFVPGEVERCAVELPPGQVASGIKVVGAALESGTAQIRLVFGQVVE
jgi:hypothetical protein